MWELENISVLEVLRIGIRLKNLARGQRHLGNRGTV